VSRVALQLARDTFAQLRHNAEIEDERRGQQGILASVVHDKSILPAHENLACILVHRAFAVADERNVLDHYHVIWVFVLGVSAQQRKKNKTVSEGRCIHWEYP
jgi:hypothetical protein